MSEVWYLKHIQDQEKMIKDLNGEVEELKRKLEEEAEEEIDRLQKSKEAKKPKFPDYSLSRGS